jgi:hypothetical protein
MSRRLEQELQKLQWHHVLPIGPYGIQPFVQPGHGQAARAGWRLAAGIGAAIRQIVALGRRTPIRMAKRPIRESIEPRRPPTPRHAPQAVRPTPPRSTAAPRPATKAAELPTQAGRAAA